MTLIRCRRFMWTAIAGLALASGCTHTSRPSGPSLTAANEKVTPLKPAQVTDMQFAMAQMMEKRGELSQAAATYEEALKKDPKRADAWMHLAVINDKQGKFAESNEQYRQVQLLAPNSVELYCNLGYSYYLQERWSEAEHCLRYAVSMQPDHKRAWNNLGLVMARSGNAQDAMIAFGNAGCRASDSHINLGYCMTLNGAFPDARREYETALALDSKSDAARCGLDNLTRVAAKMNGGATPTSGNPIHLTSATAEK